MRFFEAFGFTLCLFVVGLELRESAAFAEEAKCTRSCLVTDDNLACWEQSLDYFTGEVQKSLSNYAKLLMHISRWRLRHPSEAEEESVKKFEENSIDKVLQAFQQEDEDDRGPLTTEDLHIMMNTLLNKTRLHEVDYEDEEIVPPWVPCPTECDYYPKVWSSLFYVMLACFLLSALVLILYVWSNSRKQDGYQLQKVQFVYA